MAADIHVVFEQQDRAGQWWSVFDSGLLWSGWWAHHSGRPTTSAHLTHDPYGWMDIGRRSYYLFGALSGVRIPNLLHPYGIGTPTGILPGETTFARCAQGWPTDTSAYARRYLDNQDYHSFGAVRLDRLRDLRAELDGIPTDHLDGRLVEARVSAIARDYGRALGHSRASVASLLDPLREEAPEALERLRTWCGDVERALESVLGDGQDRPALFQRPLLQHLDEDHYDDIDAPVFQLGGGATAHSLLAFIADKQQERGLPSIDPRRLRVLVCYDN